MPDISPNRRLWLYRIAAGALLLAVAVFVLAPFVSRWQERERTIAAKSAQLSALEWDVAHRGNTPAAQGDSGRADGAVGMLSGRSVAVAASSLQNAIRRYADESGMRLDRLDVAEAPDAPGASYPLIPCSITAVGDIYGLTEFLSSLRQGRPILNIEGMSIVSTSAYGEGVLQLSVNVVAPAAIRQ